MASRKTWRDSQAFGLVQSSKVWRARESIAVGSPSPVRSSWSEGSTNLEALGQKAQAIFCSKLYFGTFEEQSVSMIDHFLDSLHKRPG